MLRVRTNAKNVYSEQQEFIRIAFATMRLAYLMVNTVSTVLGTHLEYMENAPAMVTVLTSKRKTSAGLVHRIGWFFLMK